MEGRALSRVGALAVLLAALLACKLKGNEQQSEPAPQPPAETVEPPAPVVVEGPKAQTSCARLGLYYTLKGGVSKGGVNISCDGKCKDVQELESGEKLKLVCPLACSAIGTARSKFAGSFNVTLDLARSSKDSDRYSGTLGDGKGSPNPISLSFKEKYDNANGQMREGNMVWSMTLRPCPP
jgi:hypothetical protein